MSLYRKLLPLVNKYVLIRQGMLGRAYVGRLTDVDQETLDLQTFHADGTPAETWTLLLNTITEFLSESRQLDMVALRVKWASSASADEVAALDGATMTEAEILALMPKSGHNTDTRPNNQSGDNEASSSAS